MDEKVKAPPGHFFRVVEDHYRGGGFRGLKVQLRKGRRWWSTLVEEHGRLVYQSQDVRYQLNERMKALLSSFEYARKQKELLHQTTQYVGDYPPKEI